MPGAPRVKPLDLFTPAEWGRLQRRSTLAGLGLVAHAWIVIFIAGAVFVAVPNPLTYLLAWAVIGARQLGLAVLMHEAAHGGLARSARLNEWVGEWLCAAPVGASLARYRPYHLRHHKYAQQPEDPDLGLAAPFPITPGSARRKVFRDLTGQTFLRQHGRQVGSLLLHGFDVVRGAQHPRSAAPGAATFLAVNLALLAGLSVFGLWWAYFALWLVPLATWNQLVTRLRNIAEHACLSDASDPYRLARTTRATLLERALIAPYWVNYHGEHHMFMHVPCYRLEHAHRLLEAKGITARMAVEKGYWRMLARAVTPSAPPSPA